MIVEIPDLTFDTVDELSTAAERGTLDALGHIRIQHASALGPLTEFVLRQREEPRIFSRIEIASSKEREALIHAIERGGVSGDRRDDVFGFIPSNRDPSSPDDDIWISWLYHAQMAAENVGIPKKLAHGLVGAIKELESNIYEHSERAETGVVGYRAVSGAFEFIVADRGIGVLSSLRQSRQLLHLTDAGTALRFALTEGCSRFGHDTGHGFGFRPLFSSLATLNGVLRFRSDDHALVISGRAPMLEGAHLMQRARSVGFSTSVTCRVGRT